MNRLERLIETVAPQWAADRARARNLVAAYEAARKSRTHKAEKSQGSGELVNRMSARSIREQARHLDENHDLARGVLNVLQTRCIGQYGVTVQPQIKRLGGGLHKEFIRALEARRRQWNRRPEVTRQFTYAQLERLAFRTLMRDGEVMTVTHAGNIAGLKHASPTPLSLEMLEIDFLADDISLGGGIEVNAWGQPTRYQLYKGHPSGVVPGFQTKWVSADIVIHARLVERFHTLRGMSALASVITRLADIKDYEESERIAARIAARLAAYIKKGDPASYEPPRDAEGKVTTTARELAIESGMVFDDLLPGEDVGIIESSRPSALLAPFRDSMLRAVATGTRAGYSSVSKNYNGTYSSQRQELVEQMDEYGIVAADFIDQFSRPIHELHLLTAMASGLKVPADVDLDTLFDADYLIPPMPWIKPTDEIQAKKDEIRAGLSSRSEHIRARGKNPEDVVDEIDREREDDAKRGLVFDSDAGNDKAPAAANDVKKPEVDDDQAGQPGADNA